MTKRQRSGFFVLIMLIIVAELIIQFYPSWSNKEVVQASFTPSEEAILLKAKADASDDQSTVSDKPLTNFNPNALDEQGFMTLNFSQKQAASLIKYRYILGGNFSSIEEFGEAYVISEEKLEELRPYIRLTYVPQNNNSKKSSKKQNNYSASKVKLKPFYPNRLSQSEWVAIGFSERQAQVILNFKNSLPNKRFSSAQQLHSCYAINDYMFDRIAPYLRFEKEANIMVAEKGNRKVMSTTNVNEMSVEDWVNLGFTTEQANGIVKYKDFKGELNSMEDLQNCKFITEEDIAKIQGRVEFK